MSRFIYHITQYIGGIADNSKVVARGAGYDKGEIEGIFAIYIEEGQVNSTLVVVSGKNNDVCLAIAQRDPGSPGDLEPWLRAVDYARNRMTSNHSQYQWQAIISPKAMNFGRPLQSISRTFTAAGIEFVPYDFVVTESAPQDDDLFIPTSTKVFWRPLKAKGEESGLDWESAQENVSEKLYYVCAMLSVILGQPWTVRWMPELANNDRDKIITEVLSGRRFRIVREDEEEISFQDTYIDQDKINKYFNTAEENKFIKHALSAFYEGMRLLDRNPSYALIAFVSCIEVIGENIIEMDTPDKCQSCGKTSSISKRETVYRALQLVEDKEVAEEWSGRWYPWRSKTAHAGSMHGTETTLGLRTWPDNPFKIDGPHSFSVRGPIFALMAAQKLIVHVLNVKQ